MSSHECKQEKRLSTLESSDATLKERIDNLIKKIDKFSNLVTAMLVTVVGGLIVTIIGGVIVALITGVVSYFIMKG